MTGSGLPSAHQSGQLEQRLQLIDAQHAVRAEERVGRLVRSGHGAGVRRRKIATHLGASELVDDDRFAGRRRAVRRRGEVIRVAYGFHEEQDHLGVRVVHQHAGDLADREVRFVTDRYQPRKADAAPVAPRHEAAHHAAALRDDGDRPGGDVQLLQHRVDRQHEAVVEAQEPDAIGPDDPYAAGAGDGDEFPLPAAACLAGFGESVGEDGHHRHAFRAALLDRGRNRLCRHHDEGVIDRFGDRRHVGIGALAEEFRAPRVHGEDLPAIAMLAQIALRPRGVLGGVTRGADQRDRARCEQCLRQAWGGNGVVTQAFPPFAGRWENRRSIMPSAIRFLRISSEPPAIIQPRLR